MFRKFLKNFMMVNLMIVISGCVRLYTQDVQRVDQELPGYRDFAGKPGEMPERKKTRKAFVLEIQTLSAYKESQKGRRVTQETEESIGVGQSKALQDDPLEDNRISVKKHASSLVLDSSGITEYTVEEDDTLQKIAKKFYDSYSRWNKIYEANRDKIKDPNRIQPGMIIKIPPK